MLIYAGHLHLPNQSAAEKTLTPVTREKRCFVGICVDITYNKWVLGPSKAASRRVTLRPVEEESLCRNSKVEVKRSGHLLTNLS